MMHYSQVKAHPPVDRKFWLYGLLSVTIIVWTVIIWLFWTIPF